LDPWSRRRWRGRRRTCACVSSLLHVRREGLGAPDRRGRKAEEKMEGKWDGDGIEEYLRWIGFSAALWARLQCAFQPYPAGFSEVQVMRGKV